MRRTAFLSLAALVLSSAAAVAQIPAAAPGGALRGTVIDSVTGQPVGYALVAWLENEQRVFATESGRFALNRVGSGPVTLRVQQIGYRPVTLALQVGTRPVAGAGALVVVLARQALRLPEIVVQGDVCSGVEASGATLPEGSILDEAFKNAERLLAMQNSYPFRVAFQRVTTIFDRSSRRVGGWVDTVRYDTRRSVPYRKGKVLDAASGVNRRDRANYFTAPDLANDEFRKSHCFWYSGPESQRGLHGYRINFAPTSDTKSVDWAGSMLIDSTSMTLLQSTARLVNLKGRNTSFAAAECTVFYQQLVPTLAHESQARCVSEERSGPPRTIVEVWSLSEFAFIERSPIAATPP